MRGDPDAAAVMTERLFEQVASVCIGPSASIRLAMELVDRFGTGIVLVVNDERRLVATVTHGDIRRAILAGHALSDPVTTLASYGGRGSTAPLTAHAGTSPAALLDMMTASGLHQIPLVDDEGRVVDLALLKHLSLEPPVPMSAVIMAGGYGTRLLPLTQDCPKPMLPVGGRPLLEFTLERLRRSGIRNINITTHYLSKKITDHFGDGSRFGISLHYVKEERPLGTAGALSLLDQSTEPLLVINGDIITDLDFRAMRQFHSEHAAAATVAVAPHQVQIAYGVVEHDGPFVKGIVEKPVLRHFINAGIYLIEPGVQAHVPRDARFNMTDLIERLVAAGERVVVFPVREYWIDVGQPSDYRRAQQDVTEGVVKVVSEQIP